MVGLREAVDDFVDRSHSYALNPSRWSAGLC
jgi:hypothetical protein